MNITSKVITITPQEASRYLENMVHNRPISNSSVKLYAAEIKAGRWGLNGQGIIFDGKGRLLDGQHRMHAIIKANLPITTLAVYNVTPDMFSRMDIGNKRTVADVIDVKNRVSVASAAKYVFREVQSDGGWWSTNHRLSPMDGVAIVKRHPGIVVAVGAITGMGGVKKLMPTGNAGYCYFRAGLEDSGARDRFFLNFNSGAELGVRSPVLALRNALAPSLGARITDQHQITLFITAWNSFLAGGQLKFIRIPKDPPKWSVSL